MIDSTSTTSKLAASVLVAVNLLAVIFPGLYLCGSHIALPKPGLAFVSSELRQQKGKELPRSFHTYRFLIDKEFYRLSCSLFLITFGLWVVASPSTLLATIEATSILTIQALLPPEVLSVRLGVAVVAVATFVLFISVMGLYGAFNRSMFLLFMYSALVFLLLLLECALLYYFSSSFIEKGIQEQDGQWSHALRLTFTCCEHNTSTQIPRIPWSCCGPGAYPNNCTMSFLYKKNCRETIMTWLNTYQTAIYATLAATHVILATCSLMRRGS